MGLGVNPRLEALLERMKHPHLKAIDLSLGRMERLLEALGNPHMRLSPVIHIAGTNGKGSLVAYLRAMLEAEGKVVHAYTSPHLVRFHERIRIAGIEVDDAALEHALQAVLALESTHPATFFEGTTAAAFQLFAAVPSDVTLLEVGMGGRLDATNMIAQPLLTAITPIALDHCEFLGVDIASIAHEKAGIIKRGIPVVVGPQLPEALAVIDAVAKDHAAPVYAYDREWHLSSDHEMTFGSQCFQLPKPALEGAHQWRNAATAVAVMQLLRIKQSKLSVTDDALAHGISNAHWPARLQPIFYQPWLDALPAGSRIWLDGAHNPAAAEMLASWAREQTQQTVVICGMLATKDAASYLAALSHGVSQIICVPIHGETALEPKALAGMAGEAGMHASVAGSIEQALGQYNFTKPMNILICGSLYLAGNVLNNLP